MDLRQRTVNRRSFLGGTGLAALSLFGLSACGSPAPRTGAGGSIDTFTAVFQGWGASEGMDPGINTYFVDEARFRALYDYLFEFDSQMAPVPRLAESAEPNETGDLWRVRLRDVRWHDGTALTAKDVLYTVSRVLGPPVGKPFAGATAMKIVDLSRCREIDNRTVEFALSRPSFDFPTLLGVYGLRIIKDGTKSFEKPVGTGPFRFESFTAGTQMTATAYPDYWDGAPAIQRLRILSAEADARASAIQTGQADYADELSPAAATRLESLDTLSVQRIPHCQILCYIMKCHQGPFADPKVREAMFSLVDREELNRVALEGQGQVANDLFAPGLQHHPDDLARRSYDPEKAAALLAAAGRPDLQFSLFAAPAASGFLEAAKLTAQQAARAKVTVTVDTGSKDTYYTEQKTRGDLVMSRSGPMPFANHVSMRLLSDSPQNTGRWKDPDFDTLFRTAQETSDPDERARHYRSMQEILHTRGPWLIYGTAPWRTALKKGFSGLTPAPTNTVNWARFDKVKQA